MDLSPFIGNVQTQNLSFNLCSAPVMFHIEHDPSILIEINKGIKSIDNVDYEKVNKLNLTITTDNDNDFIMIIFFFSYMTL